MNRRNWIKIQLLVKIQGLIKIQIKLNGKN